MQSTQRLWQQPANILSHGSSVFTEFTLNLNVFYEFKHYTDEFNSTIHDIICAQNYSHKLNVHATRQLSTLTPSNVHKYQLEYFLSRQVLLVLYNSKRNTIMDSNIPVFVSGIHECVLFYSFHVVNNVKKAQRLRDRKSVV